MGRVRQRNRRHMALDMAEVILVAFVLIFFVGVMASLLHPPIARMVLSYGYR